jgi:PAS domain S-box-containing protein
MASKMSTDDSVIVYAAGSKKPRSDEVSSEFKPYELLPIIYQALDSEGKFLHANLEWLRILGYERSEIIGKFFGEFLTPESLKLFEANLEKFRECGEIHALELCMKCKDSSFLFVSFNAIINRDSNGSFRQVDCVIEDVTGKRKAEAAIKHRLKMEELASAISARFIDVKEQDTEANVTVSLKEIGEFVQADRAYLSVLSADSTVIERYFEWYCKDCTTISEKIIGISMMPMRWLMGKLKHEEHLHVPSVQDLPEEAKAEREIWQEHGAHSVLVIPLLKGSVLIGYLGFNADSPQKTWTNEDARLLKVIGEIFIDFLSRQRQEQSIRERGEMLRTSGLIAQKLLRTTDYEGDIRESLRMLGETAKVSRAYIFQNTTNEEGKQSIIERYEWCAPAVRPEMKDKGLQNASYESLGIARIAKLLEGGEAYSGPIQHLPEGERGVFESHHVLSVAIVPICTGEKWWGFIGFDDCGKARVWDALDIDVLKSAAATIGSAIQNMGVGEKLRDDELRSRTISDMTSDFAYSFHIVEGDKVRSDWATDAFETVLGIKPEQFAANGLWASVADPQDEKAAQEHVKLVLLGNAHRCDLRLKSDPQKWLRASDKPVLDGDSKRVVRVIGAAQNITDLKKTEWALNQAREKTNALTSEIERARADQRTQTQDKAKAQADLERTRGELARATADLTKTKGDLLKAQDEKNSTAQELERTKADLKRTFDEKNALAAELGKTKGDLARTNEEKSKSTTDAERARSDLKGVTDERNALSAELQKTKADLAKEGEEKTKATGELEKARSDVTRMAGEKSALAAELAKTKGDLVHTNEEKAKSAAELDRTRADLKKAQDEKNAPAAELQRTMGELAKSTEEKVRIAAELEKAKSELDRTAQERAAIAVEHEVAKSELAKASAVAAELEKTRADLKRAQDERDNAVTEHTKTKGELTRTNEELAKVGDEKSKLSGELEKTRADLKKTTEEKNADLKRTTEEKNGLVKDLNKVGADLDRTCEEKARTTAELERTKDALKTLGAEKELTDVELTRAREDLDRVTEQRDSTQTDLSKSTEEAKSLGEQLEKTRQELNKANEGLKRLEEENLKATAEYAKDIDELKTLFREKEKIAQEIELLKKPTNKLPPKPEQQKLTGSAEGEDKSNPPQPPPA